MVTQHGFRAQVTQHTRHIIVLLKLLPFIYTRQRSLIYQVTVMYGILLIFTSLLRIKFAMKGNSESDLYLWSHSYVDVQLNSLFFCCPLSQCSTKYKDTIATKSWPEFWLINKMEIVITTHFIHIREPLHVCASTHIIMTFLPCCEWCEITMKT